jgi:pimeloyl-ACP methyl ester carboxylesterase
VLPFISGLEMFSRTMKRLAWLIAAIVLFVQFGFYSLAQPVLAASDQVKELNFVFLHGAGGNVCNMQLLADSILEQIPAYILDYEQANPDTSLQVNTLQRCFPNDVDIRVWANNIAAGIEQYLPGKKNLVLIGHSAGGKAALYAVSHNIDGLADKVALVVTIDSPIKSLAGYYVTGGGSVMDYCRARWLLSDQGICNSISYYDSSQDGAWVGSNKHWLAFIAAESAPYSVQFNIGGIDAWPRDMDDSAIPLSAQYADGADVIYYGEHGHSDFASSDELAGFMAEQILRYLFGGAIECSVFVRSGTFEHKANWLLGTDYWEDTAGELLLASGRVEHKNESYLRWQDWEDVVGESPPQGERSRYQVNLVNPFLFFNSIQESYWISSDNPEDYQLYLRTRAAPRSVIQVDWSIYGAGLLPVGVERNHYEVRIITGTPLTSIKRVSWLTDDPRDLRLQIWSQAESPFRWFKAEWKVYSTEIREKKIIDELPVESSP